MSEAEWDESHSRFQKGWKCLGAVSCFQEFSNKNSIPNGYNSFQKLTEWRQVCSAAFFFCTELPLWELVMLSSDSLSPIIPPLYILQLTAVFSLSLCRKLYILAGIENTCSEFKTSQNVGVIHIAMTVRKTLCSSPSTQHIFPWSDQNIMPRVDFLLIWSSLKSYEEGLGEKWKYFFT